MKQVANERVGEPRKYVGPETCLCVQKKERKEEEKKNLFAGENENDPLCVCKGRTAVPTRRLSLSSCIAGAGRPIRNERVVGEGRHQEVGGLGRGEKKTRVWWRVN